MDRHIATVLLCLGLCAALHADIPGPPVDLLDGLDSGQVWAQFWGGGDTGVNGVIGRGEGGPSGVSIRPSTQFWAQTGGRQGQTSLGRTSVNLSSNTFAQVWIPTACTNINRPAPTEEDVMEPFPCPNMDMETLCSLSELPDAPRPAVQVAVWAIANNPTYTRVRRYVREAARDSEGRLSVDSIMTGAARLLEATGLEPSEFRMYR